MTGRHYRPEVRAAVLKCIEALDGSVALTSEISGIPTRTLNRWRREQRSRRQLAREQLLQEKDSAAAAAEKRRRQAEAQLQQLRQQRTALLGDGSARRAGRPDNPHARLEELALVQLLDEATHLADSLGEAIDDAPLGQRATALNQLLDKILRILALLPRQEEVLVRVEFQDPDGTAHSTPPWARDDSGQQGAL